MSHAGSEPKLPWSTVPRAVKDDVARLLGSPVARAARVYGGYAPSATFRMRLADGRPAFFKGVHAGSNDHMRGAIAREERVYRELGPFLGAVAPAFLGAFRRDDWHAILLEDLGPTDVPPWTASRTRAAAHGYAAFHAANEAVPLPGWLRAEEWREYADFWPQLLARGIDAAAGLAGRHALADAREWLVGFGPVLRDHAARLRRIRRPYTLLHLDTRADNVRVTGGRLRIFDWNWASPGPREFDAVAFAQGIAAEGGPAPERFLAWYAEVTPLRDEVIDASAAAIPGYFAMAAPRPPLAGLPRVRSIQRRQLKASLGLAARRFALPEPSWLRSVPD